MPSIHLQNTTYTLRSLPSQCPFCHQKTVPQIISGYKRTSASLDIFFSCPDIICNRSFIGYFQQAGGSIFDWNGTTSLGNLLVTNFSETIEKISPNFDTIYNQAFQSEQYNLVEICGVGYRKALEFLIKDYAIWNHPEKEDLIKSKLLAPCIKDFVNNDRIKMVAQRAVWLGNDETHYVRKWGGKDLQDLKSLIDLTIHWIEMEELTKSIIKDMPE